MGGEGEGEREPPLNTSIRRYFTTKKKKKKEEENVPEKYGNGCTTYFVRGSWYHEASKQASK